MNSYLVENLPALQHHLQRSREWHQPENGSSAKAFFFAEREHVFTFDGSVFRECKPEVKPFVLFGLTACDLTAIAYQDRFFCNDPLYQARRKQALLVGIDCVTPCANGFCTVVEAGPAVANNHADLILTSLPNNEWLLTVCSLSGEQAVAGLTLSFARENQQQQRDEAIANCIRQFPDQTYLREGIAAIEKDKVPQQAWQELAIQCLGCTGCTMLCPTCSCYGTRAVVDEEKDEGSGHYRQERFWDSCLLEGFQRETSFHNPSADPGSRVHRFWHHKFGKHFATKFGRYGCVGCGRCEQACPGVIGVHSLMKRISGHV
jgi:sulfhydrogenase subunit beta (sulfur reductase)